MAPRSPTENEDDLGLPDSVVQLSFAIHRILATSASALDLSMTQLRMIGILRDREPGILELARYLGLDKSSVSGLVDRAERRGLVTRVRSTDDARAVRVRLTADGRASARGVTARVAGDVSELLGSLDDDERAQLSRLASHVVGGREG